MSAAPRWSEEQLKAFHRGQRQAKNGAKRANKFNAEKVAVQNGAKVDIADSKREARRLQELRLLEKSGEINNLRHHTVFDLTVNGVHICKYESDFDYYDPHNYVVEDSKGYRTPMYQLKKRLMKAIHGIEIYET